jgi:hypothetical protein
VKEYLQSMFTPASSVEDVWLSRLPVWPVGELLIVRSSVVLKVSCVSEQ